uniref:Death domain-containing protein n=1 Tax=Amphimedon queenslandica TaxID=400682 RepID=A0A1X7U9J8_AMPQE
MSSVGGSYHAAGAALKDDLIDAVQKDSEIIRPTAVVPIENEMYRKPSTTTERLPEIEIASKENGYYQDYNYLGINQPIYLLARSVINYKTTLQIKEPHNSFDNLACVILFNSLAKFDDFFRYGTHSESQMQCFTNENTSSVSWSFSIAEESQYYVGISIKRGVTVTSNVSIDRAYYNLSQTARNICTNSLSCNITVCSDILLCEKSYIIIKTKGITEVALLEYDISLRKWTIRAIIVLLPLCSLALIIIVTSYIRCYKCQNTKRRADDDSASVASSSLLEMETPFDDDDRIELIPDSNQRPPSRNEDERNEESDISQHNRTSSIPIPLSEELLQNAKDTFDETPKLQVGSNQTEYHSSQYGVTLIIPEGAVQGSATVWFGAVLFSDKFEFGDYVRVSPIVWVHSDRKLDKCVELYIPHDIVISTKDDLQKFTLLEFDKISNICTDEFNVGQHDKMKWGSRQLVKIECQYFHSYCIAVHKDLFDIVSKQYLMAIIEKKNANEELLVDFILICRQQGWKKIIAQCDQEGFKIVKYEPVSFKRGNEHELSVPFEAQHINNITRKYTAKIPVSIRDIELLDQLNEKIKFRDLPRFRIQFIHGSTATQHKNAKEITVRFNKHSSRSPGNLKTVQLGSSPLKLDTGLTKNDSVLTEFIRIIEAEQRLKTLWRTLGSRLNLSLDELSDIEVMSNNPDQYPARLIDTWERKDKSDSWDRLETALDDIGFNELACRVGNLIQKQRQNPAAAHFQSHFADIQTSIAATLNQALPKFFGAELITQSLYDDVIGMPGIPDNKKSAMVTRQLLGGIQNSRKPNIRLGRICEIFLELGDEKLKEFAESVARGNFFAKTARYPVSYSKEYSKRNFDITNRLAKGPQLGTSFEEGVEEIEL